MIGLRRSRACVWTSIAVLTLSVTFAPLLDDRPCGGQSTCGELLSGPHDSGVPRIGTHFAQCLVAGALLAVFLDPKGRFDAKVRMHRWVWRYAVSVLAHAIFGLSKPIQISLCIHEGKALPGFCQLIISLAYIASQAILCHIATLRLHIVAPRSMANRARLILKLVCFLGLLTCLGMGVHHSSFARRSRAVLTMNEVEIALYTWIPGTSFVILYTAFYIQVFVAFGTAAREAWQEAQQAQEASDAGSPKNQEREKAVAKHAVNTVCLLAASSFTSLLFMIVTAIYQHTPARVGTGYLFEVCHALDLASDVGLALVCAGLLGPVGDPQAELIKIRKMALRNCARKIQDRLKGAATAVTGPGVTLASLFGGQDPGRLMAVAQRRFRAIAWETLERNSGILTDGGTLDGQRAASSLYELSAPCALGECDVFFSHSWHDDGEAKWAALRSWCEDFKRCHHRDPTLWFDKVCIDQTQIQSDLACLPIFIAGCENLLICSGATYTLRLWCCVELFVYVQMKRCESVVSMPYILPLGTNEQDREQVLARWQHFDAAQCQCWDRTDKERIFSIICTFPGGVAEFNEHVKNVASQLFELPKVVGKSAEDFDEDEVPPL